MNRDKTVRLLGLGLLALAPVMLSGCDNTPPKDKDKIDRVAGTALFMLAGAGLAARRRNPDAVSRPVALPA